MPVARRDVSARPLIAHVVYRFDIGGLENGVVNLINRLPAFDHAVIALTEVSDFKRRVERDDVRYASLHKSPGHGVAVYRDLFAEIRRLRPEIVHTRNLAALEAQLPAALAGVPVRIHGEHGWDVQDLGRGRASHAWQRRLFSPLVHRYVALSGATERYLIARIGIPAGRIQHIYNGVDTQRFQPGPVRLPIAGMPFSGENLFVVGTVGRLQAVKDQVTLARAFVRAIELAPQLRPQLRLVIAGEGALRAEIEAVLAGGGCSKLAWLAGVRDDIPDLLRGFDLFVLPSLMEGLSNTILEAMATGLPVVATRVGGNPELIDEGVTGALVPSANADEMALAIVRYASDRETARAHGRAGRKAVERKFSIDAMVGNYSALYNDALAKASHKRGAPTVRAANAPVSPGIVTASAPKSAVKSAANAHQSETHQP